MNSDLFTRKNDVTHAFYTQLNLNSVLVGVTDSHWSTTTVKIYESLILMKLSHLYEHKAQILGCEWTLFNEMISNVTWKGLSKGWI